MGFILLLLRQKSGWECTAHDNSLYMFGAFLLAHLLLNDKLDPEKLFNIEIMNDDLTAKLKKYNIKEIHDVLKPYGILIEYLVCEPRFSDELVFLSHSLLPRYVYGFGDLMVAAGNRAKLISSLKWVRKSTVMSFDDSCLAHLLGLRLCLFPWVDDMIVTGKHI